MVMLLERERAIFCSPHPFSSALTHSCVAGQHLLFLAAVLAAVIVALRNQLAIKVHTQQSHSLELDRPISDGRLNGRTVGHDRLQTHEDPFKKAGRKKKHPVMERGLTSSFEVSSERKNGDEKMEVRFANSVTQHNIRKRSRFHPNEQTNISRFQNMIHLSTSCPSGDLCSEKSF